MKVRNASLDDAAAVAEVIRASEEAEGAPIDMAAEDIRSFWREIDPAKDVLVVENDGVLIGYVDVTPSTIDVHIDAFVHPSAQGRDVGRLLLEGAEEIAARQVDDKLPRRATIVHGNAEAKRLLEQNGYAYVRSFFRMRIVLDAPPPEPSWPEGIAVRTYVPGADDRVMHETQTEAFADSWEPHHHTLEEFVRLQAQDEQLAPAASFIALSGDEAAGAVLSKKRYGAGWIQSIGVRRPWRRAGLGRALLLHAFRAFYDLGDRSIALGVDADSPTGAPHLYERAGMHVEVQYDTYEKRLTGTPT
jgi:mycothiol synthase